MADSEEDCDTWRNRDKYPKEREPSEKKASLSPVDQKSEKRQFNNYSPNNSEPPFKRQKNNVSDDFGSTNSNRRGDNFDNSRDNFDNRKDNFDNRKGNFDNRKDSYDNRKDNYDNKKENFENRNNNYDKWSNNNDNRRGGFDNRRGGFDNRRGDFDNKRDNFDNRKDNFENRRDNFENRRDNYENRRDIFENRRDNFENRKDNQERSISNIPIRPIDEVSNCPTQPQMLLFKHFLQQQEDNIEMEAAIVKYNEYKDLFVKRQLKAFFDAHNNQEWFREKYHFSFVEMNKLKVIKNIDLRKEIFSFLLDHQWMDTIKLHIDESDNIVRLMDALVILLEGGKEHDLKILDSRRYRSESPNESRTIAKDADDKKLGEILNLDEKSESMDSKDVSKVNGNDNDISNDVNESRPLHRTFSIFLRNLHPNVLRSEIEALVKPYPGFLRLALQDPTPDRKFFRRGWVTYDRTVNIKEICWNLNNVRLHDCDIGAIVNRELTQRVRPVNFLTNHKPVMRQDIKLAAKLVSKFDKRHNLWQKESDNDPGNLISSNNPLMKNITEYLVDEGSYEEEALLGGNLNCNLELTSSGSDLSNITIDFDEKSIAVLDKLILYLRFVHSYDYYSNTEYQIEDEMPHKCGIIHARGAHIFPDSPISQKDVEDYITANESKVGIILNTVDSLSIDEAKKLGYVSVDEVEETFITSNIQEIAPDKWLCPLSGKKFKGPDFVRKHILNKHMDKVEEMKQMTVFFNNYLLDPKRPQLPEHPQNRPGVKTDTDSCSIIDNKTTSGEMNSYGRGSVRRTDFGNNNFRASSPSEIYNRDFAGRSNFGNRGGNNGSYYRKSNFTSRGISSQGRERNGDGSYYSRNMMTYNDLDAPMDD